MPDTSNHGPGEYRQVGGAWIHSGAHLGKGVRIEPGAFVGDAVTLGDGVEVKANAVLKGPTEIGKDCRIFSGAVLGEEPQDIGYDGEPTRLEIGEANVFREGVTVHRGTVKGGGVTRIGHHNFFMVGSHIGHDAMIEDHVILAGDVLIAGHCHIESHVNMGGGVALVQFTTVGRHAFVGGLSGTKTDLVPFMVHDGVPALARGVNLVGLRRGQFSRRSINCLKEACWYVFRDNQQVGDLEEARRELERRDALCPEVEELLDFMQRSRQGKYGRMLTLSPGGEWGGARDGEKKTE